MLSLQPKGPGPPAKDDQGNAEIRLSNDVQPDDRWREEHQWLLYEHQCVADYRERFKGATVWHWSLAWFNPLSA